MITFNKKNQVLWADPENTSQNTETMVDAGEIRPSVRKSVGEIGRGFRNFGKALWYKMKGAPGAVYDFFRETNKEIDASHTNKENKRDIEAARKEFKKVEKYSLSVDKLQERIDVRGKDIRGLEKKFSDQSGKVNDLKTKIENRIKSKEKLNDLELERVKIEGLEGDIKRLDKKIDKLKLTDEQKKNFNKKMKDSLKLIMENSLKSIDLKEQELFDKYYGLKNALYKKQEKKGDRTLESVKNDIKTQKETIKTQENRIKQAKTALANEIGGGFKGKSEVNEYEKLLKEQNGLEKEKNEKVERGAQHFQKAEQVLKVDKEKGEGVLTKLEQKVQEVKEHDARYKGSTWEKIKDVALGAVHYLKQGGGYDFMQDAKRKIFGASGEKGRDDVINKVENLENASLGHDKKGIHAIVEKVQKKDAVKMAQQVGVSMKPTTDMNPDELNNAQQKTRDVFRGGQGK
jgi:hypothetical protein